MGIEIKQWTEQLAQEAGRLIQLALNKPKKVEQKDGGVTDLVTETDTTVQTFIFDSIQAKFPNHQYIDISYSCFVDSCIGEESCTNDPIISDQPTWIIDPIDGTTNFVHQFPFMAVSIGFCIDRQAVLGVVYNPYTKQLFSAALGHGAYLNGTPINVNPTTTLCSSLILTEFGVNQATMPGKLQQCQRLLKHPVHAIRMLGCASMNMCLVAMGAADGYFEQGIKCWDIAAGTIIVQEAGGYVCDYQLAQPFDLGRRQVVAACTQKLATQLGQIIHHT